MTYDIYFKVPVASRENRYVSVLEDVANAAWNLRDMIINSTGLEWREGENNGLCKDVIPRIANGVVELTEYPDKYKQYEAENGYGTIHDCLTFFFNILYTWDDFCIDSQTGDLVDITYFWIC